jgi:eukaryotic-like serine/threonine-protein kinase
MNPTTLDEKEIFYQAAEIRDAAQREEYLRQACQSDMLLRQSVDAMLTDHDQATRLFQEVLTDFTLDKDLQADTASDDGPDPDLGTTIGPYRLVQRIGEGGSGIVYEAEQETPVHRKVAFKVLKPGMDKRRVMNRFQAERQALELMEHPNIARVLDAGVTHDGRPYFVMELVPGTRITEHCAKNAVPLAARLELMQQVCSAVHHAHQKGIIHRDLKPSNILVTMVEGTPVPKVIDFGIAKATAGISAEWTLQGGPVGTPAYMSPEQIHGSRDIDTRSDIYSLGVVMYELLTGRPPFEQDEPSETGTNDLRDRPLNEEPRPPSQLARQSGAVRLEWNEDLDWIVMTAIDRDRDRRYETVRGLSQDIAHYLANEPIHARPPGRLYRLRKLVQRNLLASTAIAAGILALAVGFTTSSLLYVKAQAAERLHAEAEQKQAQLRAEAEEREYVAKAAILLLQNKPAEADAEIQRMGGMLMQPSVEATNVFRQLANWNAMRGDWRAAAHRLLALSRVNRFDDSDMTENATRDLVPLAPALIEAGDVDAYRQFEKLLLDRLAHTNNPIAAEHILKICLLLPPSGDLLTRLEPAASVAEDSLPNPALVPINWLEAWRCFALGLWNYRVGHYEKAVSLLTTALEAANNETVTNVCSLAVRSMAFQKLGQTREAAADLAWAESLVKTKFAGPLGFDNQGVWNDWLYARILVGEAAQK